MDKIAVIFVVALITIIAVAISRRSRHTVTRKVGGLPAKSLCCGAPTTPLGWSQDGWISRCDRCGLWEYLGDDFDNPPPGFELRHKPRVEMIVDDRMTPALERTLGTLADVHRIVGKHPNLGAPYGFGDPACRLDPDIIFSATDDKTAESCRARFDTGPFRGFPEVTSGRFVLSGFMNPVQAIYEAIRTLGGEPDRESFDRLTKLRENATPISGFILRGYEDVQRLCELADIVVVHKDGKVFAYEPAEWADPSAWSDEGDPLPAAMAHVPTVGDEGQPAYEGPHYDSVIGPERQLIPYDMLRDPIPGTAVFPLETEKPDADDHSSD